LLTLESTPRAIIAHGCEVLKREDGEETGILIWAKETLYMELFEIMEVIYTTRKKINPAINMPRIEKRITSCNNAKPKDSWRR